MRRTAMSARVVMAEIVLLILILGIWYAKSPRQFGITGRPASKTVEGSTSDYIKWAEFNVNYEALNQAYQYDIETWQKDIHLKWIELLSYLGAKYGGDFTNYSSGDMEEAAKKLISGEVTIDELTRKMKYYSYYHEVYSAVLGGMVGKYKIQEESPDGIKWISKYGLKAYNPIAKGFPYGDYDDFGVSRSYGYKRNHLGHDMMGQVGTPVVAMCSGYIYELGWNQYGGWRIGISSFDNQRYYYYAHLRQNFPYVKALKIGDVVAAGDVIGYMGRTGYSTKENVNNIDTSHLHFGIQLIFDESQRQGNNEIWVDCYPLIHFLYQNQSEVMRNEESKEWNRIYQLKDPQADKYKKDHK